MVVGKVEGSGPQCFPVVLLHRRGIERPPALVIVLSLVTFGLYLPYWYYASHRELFDQFELEEDRKETGFIWLLYGHVVLRPLIFVYEWIFVSNLQHIRQRMGFGRSISPGAVISMTIGAMVLGVMLLFGAYAVLLVNMPDGDGNLSDDQVSDATLEAIGAAAPLFLAALILPMALRLLAYALVQAQVNQVWRAFDARIAELLPTTDE